MKIDSGPDQSLGGKLLALRQARCGGQPVADEPDVLRKRPPDDAAPAGSEEPREEEVLQHG